MAQLVATISEQTTQLIRSELRLAQLDLAAKGRQAGLGAGLFGGAGLFAVLGLGSLVAAAILALAGPLPAWLAAVVVGGGLFVVAGLAALVGRHEFGAATPAVPTEAVAGLKQDVRTLTPGGAR